MRHRVTASFSRARRDRQETSNYVRRVLEIGAVTSTASHEVLRTHRHYDPGRRVSPIETKAPINQMFDISWTPTTRSINSTIESETSAMSVAIAVTAGSMLKVMYS